MPHSLCISHGELNLKLNSFLGWLRLHTRRTSSGRGWNELAPYKLTTMKITIERLDDAFHLRASNTQGNSVETDANPDIGGHGLGMRPMEMLISSLGTCSSIDVIHILRKQRQPLDDIKVEISAEREKDKQPALFSDIHVSFHLYGAVDPDKVERAVNLSMGKYCSVTRIVEKTAHITWDWTIHPA